MLLSDHTMLTSDLTALCTEQIDLLEGLRVLLHALELYSDLSPDLFEWVQEARLDTDRHIETLRWNSTAYTDTPVVTANDL
jgi:hypothetical protein